MNGLKTAYGIPQDSGCSLGRIGQPVEAGTCKAGIYTGTYRRLAEDGHEVFLYEALMPNKTFRWLAGPAPEED